MEKSSSDAMALLDQANTSRYGNPEISKALKNAFGLEDLNDLPISYNISWYEQKAVIDQTT